MQAVLKAKNEAKRWKIKFNTIQQQEETEKNEVKAVHEREKAELDKRMKTLLSAKEAQRHNYEKQVHPNCC